MIGWLQGEVADNRSSDDELYEKAEALNGDVLQNETANGTTKAEHKTNGHHKTNWKATAIRRVAFRIITTRNPSNYHSTIELRVLRWLLIGLPLCHR